MPLRTEHRFHRGPAGGRVLAAGCVLLALVAMTGCGGAGKSVASGTEAGTYSIVTSTTVYADIARQIAGDQVKVTALISDPAQDPHSFEASAVTQLTLSRADLVIANGGGYDDFVDSLLDNGGDKSPRVIKVLAISGKTSAGNQGINEHVWYDLPTVGKLAKGIAQVLGQVKPTQATTFERNLRAFATKLAAIQSQADAIKQQHQGAGVLVTEPVPLYLLQAAGLVDRTPTDFTQGIEDESGVPPAVLAAVIDTLAKRQVRAVVFNEQTTGPETTRILKEAKANSVPTMSVTESLPGGQDYISWMSGNLRAVATVLAAEEPR